MLSLMECVRIDQHRRRMTNRILVKKKMVRYPPNHNQFHIETCNSKDPYSALIEAPFDL